MKRTALLVVIILLVTGAGQLCAQDSKKKKEKKTEEKKKENVPTFNYTIDDPFDQFNAHVDSMNADRTFLFPEFYSYWPVDKNDTILKYECYDANHQFVNVDVMHNINDVYTIVFVKTFTDYTHTYIDAEGTPKPQPVVKTLYRYERTEGNGWKATDYTYNNISQLKEYQNKIVRTDTTVVVNPVTNVKQLTIRKYYKVEEVERSNVSILNPSLVDKNDESGKAVVYTYLVPEFYFYQPKTNKDTTLQFFCYDVRDSLMPSVENFDSVRYFSLYKSYTDSAHTYNDNNGSKKLLPVSSIVKRYDRTGKDKWMGVEYPGNKYAELKEFKSVIVKTDSVKGVDPINNHPVIKVYNYYKVVKQ
jgi:hypothetical protein